MNDLVDAAQRLLDDGFVMNSPTYGGVCKYCGYKYTKHTRKYQHFSGCLYTSFAMAMRLLEGKKK